MAGDVNYGLVNPAVLDYAGQEQKYLNNQKSRLEIDEIQRAIGEQNKLNEYIKSGADLSSTEGRNKLYNYGKVGVGYSKALTEQDKTIAEAQKLKNDAKAQTLEFVYQGARNMAASPTNENIIAWGQDSVLKGYLDKTQAEAEVRQILAMSIEKRRAYLSSLGAKSKDLIDQYMISKKDQADLGIKQGNLNVAQQTLANANDPRIQEQLAAAKASGTTKGKAIATAQINLPNAIATGEELTRKIDEMIGQEAKIDKATGKVIQAGTKPHKGMAGAVGMGSYKVLGTPGVEQYIPGSSAADFKARYDEVMGGAFAEAFETLKGGGSITEKEGEKATAAKTRMRLAQSEKEFTTAAREYADVVRKGIERAKTKAASGGSTGAGEIDFNNLK